MSRILLFLCLIAKPAMGQYFEFSPLAVKAYEQTMEWRLEAAALSLAQLKEQEPENFLSYYLEDYLDFFRVYTSRDELVYQRLKINRKTRLDILRKGNPNSPYYLYTQANIRLHWAMLQLEFEDYLGGFTNVSKAYKLLEENSALFPDFLPNLKDLGILHALIGAIPDNYQWGVKLLSGLEGNLDLGRQEIETVIKESQRKDFIFEKETLIVYAFLLIFLEQESEKAWEVLQSGALDANSSPLDAYVLASAAMRSQRNDKALGFLKSAPPSEAFIDFYYLDFMQGLVYLRALDFRCDEYFFNYLQRSNSEDFRKEAWQKLGWSAFLQGKPERYEKYMKLVLDRGQKRTGGDKSAQEEAVSGATPIPALLRARLLFDGGYFLEAKKELEGFSLEPDTPASVQLEYHYRMGRILHGMKDYTRALQTYQMVIGEGADQPYYYACNAALQAGLIQEQLGNTSQARHFFEKCLDLKPREHKNSLHQEAKAGLARLGQE